MRILILLLAVALAGCGSMSIDPERDAQARETYEQFRSGRFDTLRASMTEELSTNAGDEQLQALRQSHAPSDEPSETRVLSWQWNTTSELSAYEVIHEYDHEGRLVHFRTLMVKQGDGPWRVDGFHINNFTPAEVALSAFTLRGKSFVHYGVLAVAVTAPIVCLFTAVVAGWRRRWAWMIASLFGVGQITLNWTTGASEFQVAQFALLSAGYFKGPGVLDPWMIFAAIPLPAVLFWVFRGWRPKTPKARKNKEAQRPTVVTLD